MKYFTAFENGKAVANGTFQEEELLLIDYPKDKYVLVYGLHPLVEPEETYADKRRKAYPSITELADAMYWASEGKPEQLNEYMQKVKEVKNSIPKEGNNE